MSTVSLTLRCHGCAATVDPASSGALPAKALFRCPNADRAPNIDHVLVPVGLADRTNATSIWPTDPSLNPFVRYRTLQHAYWLNRSLGATDADHVSLVDRLDASIANVCGTGFRVTPLQPLDHAATQLGVGEVWGKIDTRNVAGSHKARHLMGILLHLEAKRISHRTPLAIASCGNAAIAAATVAKAARRPVQVFIPTWARDAVRRQLTSLGASLTECPRLPSDPPGDPCLHRFHEALKKGALPFCVQGPENGFTIDGGATLGHELGDQFALAGFVPDRLFVQTGGGALGSSVVRGLRDAHAHGVLSALPKLHFVQAEGCAPLDRAWSLVARRALLSINRGDVVNEGSAAIAQALSTSPSAREAVDEALAYAATHRSQFMWAWEDPESIATGILDDETYDWLTLLRAMFDTGGWPVVALERHFERALELACPDQGAQDRGGEDCCGTDYTGASSMAGPIALREAGLLHRDERIAVLVTGMKR